jgi:hypothetical protein
MIKQLIFAFLLVIICVFSVYIGLKPVGPIAAWQDIREKPEEAVPEKPAPPAKVEAKVAEEDCDNDKKKTKSISWKSIHQSLNEKTDQLMKEWGTLKSVQGNVNILYTTDVRAVYPSANPLEILAPTNSMLNKISTLFRWALTALIFEKTMLSISVPLVFLVLIPICVLISIYRAWTYKDKKNIHKIVIVSALICFVISVAVPVSLKLSTFMDEKILSGSVNKVISSTEETDENAKKFNAELKRFRRTEASINGYLSTSNDLSNAAVKDSINYLVIFLLVYIIIPVLIFIVLYKLTRFSIKQIMKK